MKIEIHPVGVVRKGTRDCQKIAKELECRAEDTLLKANLKGG
ncbi:MAG: hypothetical protein U9R03_03610 [Candidatus Aerophobetes bacterium]|nr:hypothetical protein [Candidatus Aerophobetes bacterium]